MGMTHVLVSLDCYNKVPVAACYGTS
jgi:hypothetical protein